MWQKNKCTACRPNIYASCKVNVITLTHAVVYDESVSYNVCKSVITIEEKQHLFFMQSWNMPHAAVVCKLH